MSRRQRLIHHQLVFVERELKHINRMPLVQKHPSKHQPRWRQRVKAMKMETHGNIASKYGLIDWFNAVWQRSRHYRKKARF